MPNFDATNSALGYLYQVRYALWALLQAVKDNPDSAVSIERLDDVAFDDKGSPVELIQLKHTLYPARPDLTDASERLWKTLRIWSVKLTESPSIIAKTLLTLITTGTVSEDSATALLRPGQTRKPTKALELLRSTAQTSQNKSNKAAYEAFIALTLEQQEVLVNQIQVLDAHPTIDALETKLLGEFRVYTQFPTSLFQRLEGWWFGRAVNHLISSDQFHTLSGRDLMIQIQDLVDQLRSDTLPIDFPEDPEELELDESNLDPAQRVFVEQLKLVLLRDSRIRRSIGHFYRAFQQRTKWIDEGLIYPEELIKYERELINAWRTHFDIMRDNLGEPPEEAEMQRLGKELFDQFVETTTHKPIRTRYRDENFPKGVLHMLSNDMRVGWHAQFKERLNALMLEGARQAS
jgi:hypothetical protein